MILRQSDCQPYLAGSLFESHLTYASRSPNSKTAARASVRSSGAPGLAPGRWLGPGLGIPATAPERLTAAGEASPHHRLEQDGHTWTDTDTLLPLAQTIVGTSTLSQENLRTALQTLQAKGQVVFHKGGWQTGRCWQMEQYILYAVRALSNRSLASKHAPDKTDDSVEAANQHCLNILGYGLGQTQKDTIRTTLTHRFSMVA